MCVCVSLSSRLQGSSQPLLSHVALAVASKLTSALFSAARYEECVCLYKEKKISNVQETMNDINETEYPMSNWLLWKQQREQDRTNTHISICVVHCLKD